MVILIYYVLSYIHILIISFWNSFFLSIQSQLLLFYLWLVSILTTWPNYLVLTYHTLFLCLTTLLVLSQVFRKLVYSNLYSWIFNFSLGCVEFSTYIRYTHQLINFFHSNFLPSLHCYLFTHRSEVSGNYCFIVKNWRRNFFT